MRKPALLALVLLVTALASRASARICTIDEVPAATLLLPYFEVSLDDPNGIQTLFSINNASASAVLAHVVIWSDLSVPVLDFNVYLTGYDVQTINLRDIIVRGAMPQTASDAQDPDDTISPQGQFSQDVGFASCSGQLPLQNLSAAYVAHVQAALTGRPSAILLGLCAGRALGDNIARGYVTVDTVNTCTLEFPGDPDYFANGGLGIATNQNVLWGDYIFDDFNQGIATGSNLVHIEAAPGQGTSAFNSYGPDPETSLAGQYTFYGRYDNWSAADNREPLATEFAVRFVNGGPFTGNTSLLCWRDSKVNQQPFVCPARTGRPFWYPLGQEGAVIFDEQENPATTPSSPVSPQPPESTTLICPAEAQRVQIGGTALPVPTAFGWLYLDLNTTVAGVNNPPEDPAAAQAWVSVEMDASGRYGVGYPAIQLDSACQALHFLPGLTD